MWRRRIEPSFLAEIVPPRGLEGSMSAARGMLVALSGESFSLEIALGGSGRAGTSGWRPLTDWSARCAAARAYPQAAVEDPDHDPAAVAPGEHAVAVELQPAAEAALPLRPDWRDERDPLAGSSLPPSPRATSASSAASRSARLRDGRPTGSAGARNSLAARAGSTSAARRASLAPLVAVMALGAAVLQGWRWYEAGEWASLGMASAAGLVGVPLLGRVAMRLLRRPEPLPRSAVAAKLAARWSRRASKCAHAGATRTAPRPGAAGGGRLRRVRRCRGRRSAERPSPTPDQRSGSPPLAAVEHAPRRPRSGTCRSETDAPGNVRRTTAQRLAPAPGHATRGVRVGVSSAGPGGRPSTCRRRCCTATT